MNTAHVGSDQVVVSEGRITRRPNIGEFKQCAYGARRAAAGTAEGDAYSAHLKALPPTAAAAEIREMFAQCAPEGLAYEIFPGSGLDPETARLIARESGA
jgi:hypothetical protein